MVPVAVVIRTAVELVENYFDVIATRTFRPCDVITGAKMAAADDDERGCLATDLGLPWSPGINELIYITTRVPPDGMEWNARLAREGNMVRISVAAG